MTGESFFAHHSHDEAEQAAPASQEEQRPGTIPADLIPYLEEADRVDEEDFDN